MSYWPFVGLKAGTKSNFVSEILQMKMFIALVACGAYMSILQPLAVGQNTGQLRGRITDPSQNVISGAKVEAVNVETNISRTTTSNGAGIYSFPLLSTGS